MYVDPNRLEEIFSGALAKTSPAERAAFVDAACAGDDDLQQRILALLKAHDEAGSFLQPSADDEPLTSDPAPGQALEALRSRPS